MRNVTRFLVVVGLVCLLGNIAAAGLIGTQVTGSLEFGGGTTNYFDPAYGYVPDGYLNTAGTTVTIAEPQVEFGFDDTANRDTVDFTDTGLFAVDFVLSFGTDLSWVMTFTDAAFVGGELSELSDDFPYGGVTATLVGDTITLSWAGGFVQPGSSYEATYDFQSPAVPEPSTLLIWSLLCGLGIAATLWRKRGDRLVHSE